MPDHECKAGHEMGMEWSRGYPYMTRLCSTCHKIVSRTPMDDLKTSDLDVALEYIRIVRKGGRKKGEDKGGVA